MRPFLRRALVTGIVAGVAAVHLALVGLIVTLDGRDLVARVISIGTVLPIIITLASGFRAGSPIRMGELVRPSPVTAMVSGGIAGLVGGVIVAVMTFLVDAFDPRDVLVNASAKLVDVLHWGLDPLPGTIILVVGGFVVGAIGAGIAILPHTLRRGVLIGLSTVIGVALMQTFVAQVLTGLGLKAVNSFIYARDGMNPIGAGLVLVLAALAGWAWAGRGAAVRARFAALPTGQRRTARLSGLGVVILILASLPLFVGAFLANALDQVGLYILLGLGLNIVVGFAGLLDLGYVAFYAVGAYGMAVLTSPVSPAFHPGLNFWIAVPVVMLLTAIIGLTIGAPVLRLRGDYLAIVTLGFGEIVRIIFLSDWMTPYVGGAQGILQVPPISLFGIDLRQPEKLYYPILVACVIAAIAAISLAGSRVGRAWTAMREDESVAEATGINTTKYKLLAFSLGATFGGLAGALYAVRIGSVFPQDLNITVSINALALIILGGIGSIPGVIVGAIVLVGLPELLREFSEYRLLVYGIVLVAMMLLRPEGILPNRSRRAELHESDEDGGWDEDQWEKETGAPTPEPMIT
jgi:branched-chain amino acid transport system permease protein